LLKSDAHSFRIWIWLAGEIAGELSMRPSQPVQAANPPAGSKAGQRGVAAA
jgi:hypothetical protein